MSHSQRLGRSRDPKWMIVEAANRDSEDPLIVVPTLYLRDADGMPTGHVSGNNFASAIQQVYRQVFAPVNDERKRRLAAIGDWTLSEKLCDTLALAIVDPVFAGLAADDARVLHLCISCILRTGVRLPREFWWTPLVGERLQAANPHLPAGSIQTTLGLTNETANGFCMRYVVRHDLPLQPTGARNAANVYAQRLRVILRGLLATLMADDWPDV